MPFEVNTPLHGKLVLSDKTLESMLKSIDESLKFRLEYGLPFCQWDNTIDPNSRCEGDVCSVTPGDCPPGTEHVGAFHTHPTVTGMQPKGYAAFSAFDRMGNLLLDEKLSCVWGQEDNVVSCESPTRKASEDEKQALVTRFQQLGKITSVEEKEEYLRLHRELETYYKEVLLTDRAGLAEAKAKAKSLEDCLTYYSHRELTERARKAGLPALGGKKELCLKLLERGLI